MTAIRAVENDLNELIKRDNYRTILGQIGNSYEKMSTFIDNLQQDINSISEFMKQLEEQAGQGYDVGSSQDTLLFQKSTLENDLVWYTGMKETYIRKIYEDMWNFTTNIIKSAIDIEANPLQRSEEEIINQKFAGARTYIKTDTYTMSEIYTLLSIMERNLYELSSDIASFKGLINDATEKQNRGFSIGNLLVNLQSQETKLTLEFKGYIIRLEQFLEQNKKFAARCLKRVELISNEIVTEQELEAQNEQQEQQEQEEQNNQPDNENDAA
jgi:hypothetical protein